VWAFWDFLPTAAELAGAKLPPEIDGKLDGISMLPALLGREAAGRQAKSHEFLYWEFHEGGFKQAARMGDWKAVRLKKGAPLELYDLREDIGETRDVAGEHPEEVRRMEECLAGARSDAKDWPPKE
jgi:arylsulfatase A-like enzyme